MAFYIYWFLLALILVGLELATGTFYLLVMAIAMAVGGIFALLGLVFPAQLVLAGLAGIVGIILLQRWKSNNNTVVRNQSLDAGQSVQILSWKNDGTARVFYRGTEWDAELATKEMDREGLFYIKELRGSVLILTNRKPVCPID